MPHFVSGSGMTVDHHCCVQPVRGVYIVWLVPKLCSLRCRVCFDHFAAVSKLFLSGKLWASKLTGNLSLTAANGKGRSLFHVSTNVSTHVPLTKTRLRLSSWQQIWLWQLQMVRIGASSISARTTAWWSCCTRCSQCHPESDGTKWVQTCNSSICLKRKNYRTACIPMHFSVADSVSRCANRICLTYIAKHPSTQHCLEHEVQQPHCIQEAVDAQKLFLQPI